jgi:hypothetical protein
MEVNLIAGNQLEGEAPDTYPSDTQQPYRHVPTTGDQFGGFLIPVPSPLPSMMYFHGDVKQKDDTMKQFEHPDISHASRGYEYLNLRVGTILNQRYNFNGG